MGRVRESADEYVLGTDDDEIARLELQHGLWRDDAVAAWHRAGIRDGHRVIDIGCGPGFATADLAELVGATGAVHALDRSARYLELVSRRSLAQVTPAACDLDRDELPVGEGTADAAWARWVFCFLARPRDLLARIARSLAPGGVLVVHEYFDYRTWRATPRMPELEEFVIEVMESWRAGGGEPDIGMAMLPWLAEAGFDLIHSRPIVDLVDRAHPKWQWLERFGDTGLTRLVELGRVTSERASEIRAAWARLNADVSARQVTPAVIELIAVRR